MRMTILSPEDIDKSKFLLPLYGAEDPDEDDKEKGKKKGKDSEDDDDDDDDDEDDLSKIEDPKDRRIAELSSEAAKRRRERNTERKAREAAEAERDKLANAGKSAEETLKAELEKEKERNSTLTGAVTKNLLRNEILEHDKYKWHDVSLVIKELDHDELEVDIDEMKVDGLTDQLKKLAKEKPFLLKGKSKEDDSDDDQNNGGGGTGSTGHNPRNGGRGTGDKVTQREALVKKYPYLAQR